MVAMKEYGGVPLDGKPLKIEMAATQTVMDRNEQQLFHYIKG